MNPISMERVFGLPEMVQEIISHIPDQQSLAYAALVARSWRMPAQNNLYHDVVLPQCNNCVQAFPNQDERLLRRVRRLKFAAVPLDRGYAKLPSLQQVEVVNAINYANLLAITSAASLKTLRIGEVTDDSNSVVLADMLAARPGLSTNLEYLSLLQDSLPSVFVDRLGDIFGDVQAITLNADSKNEMARRVIAGFPNLRYIDIFLQTAIPAQAVITKLDKLEYFYVASKNADTTELVNFIAKLPKSVKEIALQIGREHDGLANLAAKLKDETVLPKLATIRLFDFFGGPEEKKFPFELNSELREVVDKRKITIQWDDTLPRYVEGFCAREE